jgi:LysM repeat protein
MHLITIFRLCALLLVIFFANKPCFAKTSCDSVGLIQKNNQTYLVHKVLVGENLIKIAFLYKISVADIRKHNAGLDSDKIKAGQLLHILLPSKQANHTTQQYTVKQGDNLSKIALLYQTKIDSLVLWNNLPNSPLQVGQVLVIGRTVQAQSIFTENMLAKLDKKKTRHEIGKGEKIVSRGNEKFVLHRKARVGSFILLVNPTNHFVTKAKVIGKIPDIDLNKDILVKMSAATCKALDLVNENFAIEVIYTKN